MEEMEAILKKITAARTALCEMQSDNRMEKTLSGPLDWSEWHINRFFEKTDSMNNRLRQLEIELNIFIEQPHDPNNN